MAEKSDGTVERVALELMQIINHALGANADKTEHGILSLYAKCRRVVNGGAVKND